MRTLWFEQTIKEAVDAPRIHHQLEPMKIMYEYGNVKVIATIIELLDSSVSMKNNYFVLQEILKGLGKLGHKLERYEDRGSIICSLYKNGTVIQANADYRKGGDVSGINH